MENKQRGTPTISVESRSFREEEIFEHIKIKYRCKSEMDKPITVKLYQLKRIGDISLCIKAAESNTVYFSQSAQFYKFNKGKHVSNTFQKRYLINFDNRSLWFKIKTERDEVWSYINVNLKKKIVPEQHDSNENTDISDYKATSRENSLSQQPTEMDTFKKSIKEQTATLVAAITKALTDYSTEINRLCNTQKSR